MLVPPSDSWKLVLAVALFATVVASAWARPPRRSLPGPELRRLVLGAVALYGVGLASMLTHHALLAVGLYAGGIAVSALASWLSRGTDAGPPPGEEAPADEPPSPSPGEGPRVDWAQFQRDFEQYARRRREPIKSR